MKALIGSVLSHFPLLKRMLKGLCNYLFPSATVSSHYVFLQHGEAYDEGQRLRDAWQNDALPQKQRKIVEQQLHQYRMGARIDVFDVFADSLRALPDFTPGMSLLEIGCSSGFYSEVIDIASLPINYSGCDYSPAFIQMAREKYPELEFSVDDATNLHYPDQSFDITVSGCCLLHIPEYATAVAETARVTSKYAIFHRTPVVFGQSTQWYRKQAYGIETVEIHFNESEFLTLLNHSGLTLLETNTLHEENRGTSGNAIRTYICEKKAQHEISLSPKRA